MKRALMAVAISAAPSAVHAHAGHAGPGLSGWTHYVSDPIHLLPVLAATAFVCGVLRLAMRRVQTE
jgi:hypothetical protein